MDLLTSLDLKLTSLRSDFAAIKVQMALRKLARAVELAEAKAGFDPNQPRDDRGQWTNGPKIPPERPPTGKLRNRVVKEVARWLAKRAIIQALGGPIGTALNVLDAASWLYDHAPYIRSYLDEPKSLEELQEAVSSSQKGYDIHHIVEQTPAEQDGFPRSMIDAPENLVRVPTLKHWEINRWYETENENYGGLTPREYIRGRDWSERVRIGRDALIEAGVLRP